MQHGSLPPAQKSGQTALDGKPADKAPAEKAPQSLYGGVTSRRVTVRDLASAKQRGERWPMLTAYDAPTAAVLDRKSTRLNSSHVLRSRMPSSA